MKFLPTKITKRLPKFLRQRKFILLFLATMAFLFLATRGGIDVGKIQTTTSVQKNLESQVQSSGKIKSENTADLKFSTSGRISWINIKKGQHVTRGQILATLDTQDLEKRLKRDLNTYFKTRLDFEDVKDSQENEVITDTAKRIAQRSQLDLDNSVIDVELKDLAIKFSTLVSPIEGYIVDDPKFFAGTNIIAPDSITTVSGLNKLLFVAEVDETEIGKIKVGQKATVTLDAFQEEKIESTVDSIAPATTTTATGATVFEVNFSLPSQNNYRLGMNGEVKITIESAETALVIPLETLVDDKYVWVKKNNQHQKREITKGLASDTEVQITSGLEEGQTIVTSGFDQIGKKSLIQKLVDKLPWIF
ncbi:hypothetical protein A2697_03520 [Candidatus Curtissbacteria bacterium RIFCSPHIGHO2_01_FULL_41_44]|uniref:RND efflux pump membrane fusion protein barrel-sandwich domain-containing protein n=1 Tax=Candidatus Curtissbacteria bacterium RIFCSPLOWO2_01_FULL_42_50 TaxID=1797730 RepID=A0A1F5H7G3_9BACT|nr:MAG: hypothetical protein A2697_03520 [Candidatus Curtissbacteria bacterium RIFCSPHIGHO2_01_FULL_41_44]OGD94236.1 MAG: hypothetical protein A3C33_02675 [Candidatus Curtissbacteria bacterium RIFCSPHIGHO2_02_FULL_42_58]OGD97710.1 MAG: hypothetical protein A3E71_03185 [Candidatus Curtissbacteria bacterium RIFCSPHIGHO2_12_FULL_42_33]OGE00103.1 MAG: hypothetical protein A3B54_01735 [Candidatus Curtissbacteria bacterium RIFCSPLOWO2_01_FULL_42_50]